MASKKHPLDVFRSSTQGFDSASRSRRALSGKVTVKSMQGRRDRKQAGSPGPRGASARASGRTGGGTTAASRASGRTGAAARPSSPPARAPVTAARRRAGADKANRVLLLACLVLVAGLSTVLVVQSAGDDVPPPLSREVPVGRGAALERAAPAASVPVTGDFGVLAATYRPAGLRMAHDARDELERRGFPEVLLIAYPGTRPGEVDRYELIVGRGGDERELAGLLARLRRIDDWPSGARRPFTDALVIPHPIPAG